ncbi:DUF7544 domain-containing protein [Natrinema salaciae]|uniref:Uncharacterized protein n=1 Tax=Natrinema salaciae TaxID=1186196 RepID=A0A1H9GFN8_9EURY|nr:hypothetical protein [Natrinema salaciae]SEQ48922.1 hypothetical protein SAMN04489841_1870 [Natrinema salaciae]
MFATKDLSDAIDVTRSFLASASLGMWVKLAIIVFFVGGIGFGSPTVPGGGGDFGGEPTPGPETDPGAGVDIGELLPILIVVGIIVVAIGLVFGLLSALFEFTLLESLRSGEVHIRRYTKRNFGLGVSLFGFRIAIGLIALVIVGGPILATYLLTGSVSFGIFGLMILLGIPVYLVYAVISRFTTVFVAPTMLQEDLGVVAAWKRFWPTMTANWKEYLAYLVLVWIVQFVLTFALGIVLLVVFLVLAIPLILIALIPIIGIIVVLLAVPLIIFVVLLVQVPLVTYLRYYALLVLGDTDAELDLIPDQRAAIRGGDTDDDRRGPNGPTDGWGSGDDGSDGWDSGSDDSDGWDSDSDDSDGWDSDSDGSDGWDSTDETRDDGTSGGDDGGADSWGGPDRWNDSSESDDDRDDRDDRDGW